MTYISKLLLMMICIMGGFATTAKAADYTCDAMADVKTYSDNNSFKMLVPGADGWTFRSSTDFKEDFSLNSAGTQRFKRFKEALKHHDVELIVAFLPTRGMMHAEKIQGSEFDAAKAFQSYLKVGQQIKDEGIAVAVADAPKVGDQPYFYKRDHHWTPYAAQKMARSIAGIIKAMPFYEGLNKVSFSTKVDGDFEQEESFSRYITKKCDIKIPKQVVPNYKTFTEATADDLFGDVKPAEIILVGTSNSTQSAAHANFDGFLREYTGVDIDNVALSGGGVDSALYKLFLSDKFLKKKPKAIIWEIPIYQDIDSGPLYRQVIPTAFGSCKGNAVASNTFPVTSKMTLPESFIPVDLKAKGHYLEMRFDNWDKRKMRVSTNYKGDQKADSTMIRRVKKYVPDGIFFYEFDQNTDAVIKDVDLILPKGIAGNVNVNICKYPD